MISPGRPASPPLLRQLPTESCPERPASRALHQQQVEWNDTRARFPTDSRLHDLVAAQARQTPDAIAVSSPSGMALTFDGLFRRSLRLCVHLRRLGVGPEQLVGVHLERSPDVLVALLGTLFAGGAFLPLDPSLPARRLRFMLDDARPRVILASRGRRRASAWGLSSDGARLLFLEELGDVVGDAVEASTPNIASPPVDADHPAYVLYTSGSTGRPKAVVVSHRAVCNHRHWMQSALPLGGDDRILHTAALNFDGAIWEIFAPLVAGAQLVLAPKDSHRDPGELAEVLERARITVLRVVASMLRPLLERPGLRRCRNLRRLVSVGEALAVELRDSALATLPGRALYNLYGPSEATIHATAALCRAQIPRDTVPIGRPIANVRCHVLDAEARPIAPGEAGALFIGGPGLARGYLHRPRLSAERFMPDPFGSPGSRLYDTGDRARRLADGALAFLGRFDHQVKIRGYRVELGEIERTFSEHSEVAEAAVRRTTDGRLVAYAVAHTRSSDHLDKAWRDEHVEQWRTIYDSTYSEAEPDTGSDLAGWDSSYTGRSLPADHITDAVDHVSRRLLQLLRDDRRALEIGCGTGLLLYRVAPSCERFLGTDLSPAVVAALRSRLNDGRPSERLSQVEVRTQPAHDFTRIEPGGFDLVFCNSVVGHFPSADYLLEVIEGMVRAATPGGRIFIGDVRNLPLEEALIASIEAFKAPDNLALAALRERVHRHLRQEDRLSVDPAFFAALSRRLPRITGVRIWPKGGRLLNELTRFRFDVVLELDGGSAWVGDAEADDIEVRRVDWRDIHTNGRSSARQALAGYLEHQQPTTAVISNVPNARAKPAVELLARLRSSADGTVSELGQVTPESSGPPPEVPEAMDLMGLSELDSLLAATSYRGEISWARCDASGDFDLALWRSDQPRPAALDAALLPQAEEPGSWSAYTNDPLDRQLRRRLVPEWRAFLEERLPEYMVPSAYVLLETMPRTPGGKLDRRALPAPEATRPELSSGFVAPRSADEERLAAIWCQVLSIDRVGVHDNFFELGGHSLLGTRVMARVRDGFGLELPLRSLFDGPTLAEQAVCLARARRHRPEAGRRTGPTIERVTREQDLPLSFAQQRLWFLHQLHPESPAYNSPRVFRLHGPLNVGALEEALRQICQRHEILRTTFPSVAGQPRQEIARTARPRLPVVDLARFATSEDRRDRAARRLIAREIARPFDLARGPLLRGLLVRLGAEHHLFLLNLHHIVTDGWSEEILYRELATFYAARLAGRPGSLPELEVQYADFAVWQRAELNDDRLEEQLSYWRRQLRDLPPLDFPSGSSRESEAATDAGAVHAFKLSPRLGESLEALSLRAGTSPFITLLAAFAALLHRTTGRRDLAVGSPIANRDREELEGLIGFFVNMLVMRARIAGEPRFGELLGEVRDVALGAYAHQDLPFEKLVEELRPDRGAGDHPLFDVVFALHNVARSELALAGLEVDPLDLDSGAVRFALEVHLWQSRDRLQGSCVYRKDRFESTAVARLIAHFETLLAGALERPDLAVDELPLLTPAQRHQQLVEWNDTRVAAPAVASIAEAFETRVARRPDAVAVIAEGGRQLSYRHLSYRELNDRAGWLAKELRGIGVAPERPVGLCVEPSAEMIVGLLAILKAGGAYLPLDPSYPRRRLRLMLRDAGASWLLIQENLIPKVLGEQVVATERGPAPVTTPHGRQSGLEIVYLGEDESHPRADASRIDPANLACVLYTSGSTGRPKGIGLTHRSLLGLALATNRLEVRPRDRVAQLSNLSFDAATYEIWATLLHGATLVVLPADRPLAPERLAAEVSRQRVDTLFLTTALFNLVMREHPAAVRTVKNLLFGGEAAEPHWVRIASTAGPERLLHFYGPAENTTFATGYSVHSRCQRARVPIGLPVSETELYVLSGFRNLPAGSPGELHIAGAGLARGYLGRSARTAERFVPDPFGDRAGARLYRSGDLVRQRPDGNLEFLGRVDHQVKIRGFRVEPSEVEVVLKRHTAIRDAIVLAHPGDAGDRGHRLVAYVVPASPETSRDAWRSFLARRLPAYMVPSAFIRLDELPLTPGGKVDRRALPAPEDSRPGLAVDYLPPRTQLERKMATIWAGLLGLETVGVRDNFFELGGHSLLAIRVISRVRSELRADLPLRSLFDHPTVADLCRHLAEFREARDDAPLEPQWSVAAEDLPELAPTVPGRMEEGRI